MKLLYLSAALICTVVGILVAVIMNSITGCSIAAFLWGFAVAAAWLSDAEKPHDNNNNEDDYL